MNNPKRKESLAIMLHELDHGRLGAMDASGDACIYDDGGGKHCVVGCRLTKEQLEEVHKLGLNENSPVETLIEAGIFYPESWGFSSAQLAFLQAWHDNWAHGNLTITQFRDVLQHLKDTERPTKLLIPSLIHVAVINKDFDTALHRVEF